MSWVLLLTLAAFAGPYEEGVEAMKRKDFATAERLLSQAAHSDITNAAAFWELGWAYWMQDDFAGATEAWQTVERLDPDRPELAHWLGSSRARQGLEKPAPPGQVPLEADGLSVSFAAAGDTMMGSDLRKGSRGLAPGNGEVIFADVADVFQAADVAFVNIEGPLADGLPSTKCGPTSTSCYAFRTPTRYTAALTSAGIDLVSLANNHAFDLGAAGQQSSMDALDAVGIAHAGRYGDVGRLSVGEVSIAMVAAHSGSCCLNVNDLAEVQAAVALADAEADIVILSFHGGAEGSGARHVPGKLEIAWGEHRGDVRALARAAIDAGADLVLGHGPHVLRAMEVYRGRLVAYSLGNFTGYKQFGRSGGYGGTTVILEAELAANGVLRSARLRPIALDADSVPKPDPTGLGLAHVRELSASDFPETGVSVAEDGTLSWR